MSPPAAIPVPLPRMPKILSTVLPLTIPPAVIPTTGPKTLAPARFDTCNPSTIEPSPRCTPSLKCPEIDPFRTVMPVVLPPASIAVGHVGNGGTETTHGEVPVIVKPARSIVTKLAVIDRQALPAGPLKVRFLRSLYEPDLSIGWHFSIS